jgi:pyruvate/2-oxoglutarate dehydrogenase complex dihydrolipoamide dehydrogenase (E3) component
VVKKEATAEDINKGAFDAAIVAAGATLRKFDIQGIDNPMVTDALKVFGGNAQIGQRAVVIGGGATGTEVAIYLAEQGKEVTVVEMLDEILTAVLMDKPAYLKRLFAAKVSILTGMRLESVLDKAAFTFSWEIYPAINVFEHIENVLPAFSKENSEATV